MKIDSNLLSGELIAQNVEVATSHGRLKLNPVKISKSPNLQNGDLEVFCSGK